MRSSFRGGPLVVAELLVLACLCRARLVRRQQGLARQVPNDGAELSSCGMDGKAAGCANIDLGSCGNACCALEYSVNVSADDVHKNLQEFLMQGGDTNAYSYLQNDSLPDNITSKEDFKYVVQGLHRTKVRHYVDYLHFNIRNSSNDTKVVAFSMSSIPGALSDLGQNYKTLHHMFSKLYGKPGEDLLPVVLYGCGKNTTAARLALAQGHAGKRARRGGAPLHDDDDDDDDDDEEEDSKRKSRKKDDDDEGDEDKDEDEDERDESTCMRGEDLSIRDCHKTDLGSCGHACCAVDVKLDKHAEVVHKAIRAFLSVGGDSHTYKRVKGTMPFKEHPAEDVRDAHLAAHDNMVYQYILQANHTNAYNITDRMNINIRASKDLRESIMRVFVTSMRRGSLSDEGQNFKTIMYMVRQLHISDSSVKVVYGCGREAASSATVGKWATFMLAMAIACLAWQT